MTARELLQYQLDDSQYQLEKCFEGLPSELFNAKVTEQAMTPAEVIEHLCEAYTALIAESEGKKHEWGSYKIEDRSPENLLKTWSQTRERATATIADEEPAYKHAHAFIVAHDYYHVGQLCELRVAKDPGFDPYAIYRM